eukprot:3045141-Amphidinium_carterae.1
MHGPSEPHFPSTLMDSGHSSDLLHCECKTLSEGINSCARTASPPDKLSREVSDTQALARRCEAAGLEKMGDSIAGVLATVFKDRCSTTEQSSKVKELRLSHRF